MSRKRHFAKLANAAAEAVRGAQERIETLLESTARFVEASDVVTAQDFITFAKPFNEVTSTGELMLLTTGKAAWADPGGIALPLRAVITLSTCIPPGRFCAGSDLSPLLDWPALLESGNQAVGPVSIKLASIGEPLDVNFIAVRSIPGESAQEAGLLAAVVWNSDTILETAKASLRSGAENVELAILNIEANSAAFEMLAGEAVRYHEDRLAWHHPLVSMTQSYVLAATPTPLFYIRTPLRITPLIGIAGVLLTLRWFRFCNARMQHCTGG